MTPDKHQLLIDILDKGHAPLTGNVSTGNDVSVNNLAEDDAETTKEKAILRVALEAIQYNALSGKVKSILQDLKAGEIAELPVKASVEVPVVAFRDGTVRRFSMSSRRIAAVLLFATCLGGAGKYLFTSPSGVFDSYYSSYTVGSTRGGEGLNALEKAYQDKDWSAVVHTFQFTRSKTGKDYFLTGMAYMEQKEYYEAIGLFKSLIASNAQSKEPYFQDEAEYYLAMSYLATHQAAPAMALLDKIKSDPLHLFNKQVSAMSGIDLLILHAK
jgi:hypothetical protein